MERNVQNYEAPHIVIPLFIVHVLQFLIDVSLHGCTVCEDMGRTELVLEGTLVDVLQGGLRILAYELADKVLHGQSVDFHKFIVFASKTYFLGMVDYVSAVTAIDALDERTVVVALLRRYGKYEVKTCLVECHRVG